MKQKDIIRFLIFRTLGNFFILLTLFGFLATFGPALYFEARYRIAQTFNVEYTLAQRDVIGGFREILEGRRGENSGGEGLFSTIINGKHAQVLLPKSTEFSLVIPKIGANEEIVKNVDPSNRDEYTSVLQKSLAHAQGSAFPGMDKNIYVFAHSADSFWSVGRYNAVFYLLKELEPGDEIIVFFHDRRYNYVVFDKKTVDANDVSHIAADASNTEQLTLQTCWPPGTTWKRLLVFAKPKGR